MERRFRLARGVSRLRRRVDGLAGAERVSSGLAIAGVGARAAVEAVVAGSCEQCVVTGEAEDAVVTGTRNGHRFAGVGPVVRVDLVRARASEDEVVAGSVDRAPGPSEYVVADDVDGEGGLSAVEID